MRPVFEEIEVEKARRSEEFREKERVKLEKEQEE
jgi:hypothetical protein